jgi:fused signal recognition particle receptor
MDPFLLSLKLKGEKLLGSIDPERLVSEPWIWGLLLFCVFLILSIPVRLLLRRRRIRREHPQDAVRAEDQDGESGEAFSGESSADLQAETSRTPHHAPAELRRSPISGPGEGEERLLDRLRGRLARTHDQLIGRLDQIFLKGGARERQVVEDLEEVLLTADLGVKTSYELLGAVQREFDGKPMGPVELKAALRCKIAAMLDVYAPPFALMQSKPYVIMVVGVNGVGKTTSIGKLAFHFKCQGRSVMLVAADTFRAAAIEQLEVWSDRVGTDFVKHKPESDPSAVVYDAMQAAKARGADLVIVDTAGRLHTKVNLMEELKKVKRIISREVEGAPQEVLLVVDATTGQNAINQARTFHASLGVTGIILTKLDGTAKGGVVVGIANELQLPVRFIGIGEQVEDLRLFDAELFLEAIFGEPQQGWVH